MSTTYSATTKDASSSKDKDASDTSTYVRSGDNVTESSKTSSKNKTTLNDTDKSQQDSDTYQAPGKTQYGFSGQYGQRSTFGQQQQDGDQQQQHPCGRGGVNHQNQQEVQQKLKEVGNLLQKAGQLLQDLQCCAGEGSPSSSFPRGPGGNYSGPYGGFEAHPHQSGQYGQHNSSSQYGFSGQFGHPSGQQQLNRYFDSDRPQFSRDSDREDRYNGRSNFPLNRFDDRFEGRQDRGNVDRFGGFGGPNRPDLAYGHQYGVHGAEGRRGGDFELGRRSERW